MRVLLSAVLFAQAVAFAPAHADCTDLASASNSADLEKTFWVCDYAGTNGVVDMDQAAACVAVTDELKRVKFGGDFDSLVAWWKLNKVARHQELDRTSIAAIEREQSSGEL